MKRILEKKIIIWGTGNRASYLMSFLDIMREVDPKIARIINKQIYCFIDSKKEKQNREYYGRPILDPKEISWSGGGFFCVIAVAKHDVIDSFLEGILLQHGVDYCTDLELIGMLFDSFTRGRVLSERRTPCKTIGIFLWTYGGGGAERVVSYLMPMYMKMGYHVVLFVGQSCEHEYELPEGVTRIDMEFSRDPDFNAYIIERHILLRKYNIDIACFHIPYEGIRLFYDLALAKCMGIRTVVENHTSYHVFIKRRGGLDSHDLIYSFADYLVVLSREDENFWKDKGCHAVYIPNPCGCLNEEMNVKGRFKEHHGDANILWIGKIAENKGVMEVVPIMKRLVKNHPEAKLQILGGTNDQNLYEKLRSDISQLGLEDHIILCGVQPEVKNYYKNADIYLMTSPGEGFPMSLAEAKSFGLPTVMYDLPYLEMVRDRLGVITVAQKDADSAAHALAALLEDNELYDRLSSEARISADYFASYDLEEAWRAVLEQ